MSGKEGGLTVVLEALGIWDSLITPIEDWFIDEEDSHCVTLSCPGDINSGQSFICPGR
jgi:hypothetical protein